jgi:hypothetical protein
MEDKIKQDIILDEQCGIQINSTFNLFRVVSTVYLIVILFTAFSFLSKLLPFRSGAYIEPSFISLYRIIPIIYLLQFFSTAIGIYYQYVGFKKQRDSFLFSDSAMFIKSYSDYRKGLYASLIATIMMITLNLLISYRNALNF